MWNVPLTQLRRVAPHSQLFRCAEPLARLLDAAGDVELVVSSSWRHSLSNEEIRVTVPELASWIVGALDRRIQHRGVAVKAWLERYLPFDYRVIDDDAQWFDERFVDAKRLIVTNQSDCLNPEMHAYKMLSKWLDGK